MPRYFFNVRDGRSLPDIEGTDLPDRDAARRMALRFAGELMHDQAGREAHDTDWYLEVTDEAGAVFFRVDFRATDTSIAGETDPGERMGRQVRAVVDPLAGSNPRHARE